MNFKRKFKTVFFVGLGLILLFSTTSAMPPHPIKYKEAIDNGNQAYYTTAKVNEQLVRGIDAPSKVTSLQKAAVTGTFRALAVLIQFPDAAASVLEEDFDTLIFVNQMGTVTNYYRTVSNQQLDIVTLNLPSAIGWVTAPQNYSYYVNGEAGTGTYPNNTQKLCEDIAALVDPVVDFSDYDNNGDGYVDAFILVHSGPGREFTSSDDDIHSHKWAIWPPQSYDGVSVYEYCIQPEYMAAPGDATCGVFCHELGHVFGLPDLYDTDYSSRGAGLWTVMATGSWLGPGYDGSRPAEFDAYSRITLGFSNVVNVTSNMDNVTIDKPSAGGDIYRLWTDGAIGSEYFLVELRQQNGYDAYLPGNGLLIWHIDETVLSQPNPNDNEWYPGYTSNGHYGVALEQADGLYELEQLASTGDAADPFPGSGNVTSFSFVTTPNSNSYSGSNTYVSVSNIYPSAGSMIADFQVSIGMDVAGDDDNLLPNSHWLGQNYPNPFNPNTTITINMAERSHLILTIYDILGRKVNCLADDIFQAGQVSLSWDGTDHNGNSLSSGVYFYEAITDNDIDSKKMLLVK